MLGIVPPPMPIPSKNQVDKAGKFLRDLDLVQGSAALVDESREREARQVVQTFRQAHAYPMLRIRIGLEGFCNTTKVGGAVTQRHKRVERIIRKLRRMRDGSGGGSGLYRLEDIGGCRVVLGTPKELDTLAAHIRKRWKSDFARDPRDYVNSPKPMGYRAQHIVVRRDGRATEIQLRTRGQQQWADAVEDIDARFGHTGISLKDEQGPEELKAYFRAAGEVIYRREYGVAFDDELFVAFDEARQAVIAAGYYTE